MRGTDAVMIFLTFLTGLFMGAYLYVSVFAPDYANDDGVVAVDEVSFSLQGEAYGGCRMTGGDCGRFTLAASRAFTYLPPGDDSEQKGFIDHATLGMVMDTIEAVPSLERLTEATNTRCNAAFDGIDYRYRLIYEGEEYEFTTCSTRFTTSDLAAVFEGLWMIMEDSEGPADGLLDVDLGGIIEQQIDDWFQYDDN